MDEIKRIPQLVADAHERRREAAFALKSLPVLDSVKSPEAKKAVAAFRARADAVDLYAKALYAVAEALDRINR